MNRTIAVATWLLLLASSLPVGVDAQELEEVEIFSESDSDIQTESGTATTDPDEYASSDLQGLYLKEGPEHITFRIQVRQAAASDDVVSAGSGVIDVFFQLGDAVEFESTRSDEEDDEDDDDEEAGTVSRIPSYALEIQHGDSWTYGEVYVHDPAADRYVYVGELSDQEMFVDAEQNSFIAHVPRDFLLDFNGAQVSPALPLHSFRVESIAYSFGDRGEDTMPDSGEPEGEFIPELGVNDVGHLRLTSNAPVRASNGEATTYVYNVRLASTGNFIDDVDLVVHGAPPNWEIKLPAESVRIDNETVIDMPILVTIPFGHQHGTFQSFVLEAQSNRDRTAFGRIELGVRFTEIPQPTGHHSLLWLHSYENPANEFEDGVSTVGGSRYGTPYHAYFNAADEFGDPRDKQIPIPPEDSSSEYGGGECATESPSAGDVSCMTYEWTLYLEPSLQMGLDFDLDRTGLLTVPFRAEVPMENAFMEGELLYQRSADADRNDVEEYDPEEYEDYEDYQEAREEYEESTIILGTFAESEHQSTSQGGTADFESVFTPTPESDFLLYEPEGATMWMQIRLTVIGTSTFFADGQVEPELMPGGELDLPLNEYHDPVDDLYNQLTDVDIEMESDQEQYVNTGETILFEVRIKNTGVVNDHFRINVTGHNKEWARILGDDDFPVRSQETRRVVVAVRAPIDAVQGDTADLVLEAVSQSDENARALVRLYTEVDNLIDHEDKSYLVPYTQDELTRTPFGAWVAPLALLGAVLLARRRST